MFYALASPTPTPTLASAAVAVAAAEGWSWEATATIIQAVATIVALAGLAITVVYSLRAERREHAKTQAEARRAADDNRRAREEAERSDASAERAERAAALSIDTMARIADAVEALSEKGIAATVVPSADPARVRWSLEHFNGDTYMLKNIGNATAHDVHVTADPTLMTPGELPAAQDLRPDDSVTFMAAASLGTRDKTITVHWSTPDDEVDEWRYPLPPRPPRGVQRPQS